MLDKFNLNSDDFKLDCRQKLYWCCISNKVTYTYNINKHYHDSNEKIKENIHCACVHVIKFFVSNYEARVAKLTQFIMTRIPMVKINKLIGL